MIVTGALLFLLGASATASPFLPSLPKELIITKNKHGADKVTIVQPPSSHSSIIENYIQQGTNVFFKPQFVLSSEQMPPQLQPLIAAIEKDDCKTTYPLVTPVIVDEPLRVVEKEINGPLMTTIEHITEIKPTVMLPEPVMPVVVPPAPVLPPMEPPKGPLMVEEIPLTVEIPYGIPAPMAPVFFGVEESKEINVPVVIPPGPVLPPIELPKLPVLVEAEVPCDHFVPVAPVVELKEKVVEVPFMIPPSPVLPPMAMPNLPVLVEETPLVADVHPLPVAPEVSMAIPPGPVLPPIELPKLPVMVENNLSSVVELPCEHPVPIAPVFVEVERPQEHVLIPPAPVLPPLEMPSAPVVVKKPLYAEKPIHVVPSAPLLSALEVPTLPFSAIQPHAYMEQNRFVLPVGLPYPDTSKLAVHIPEVPQMMVSSNPDFTKTKDCVNEIIVERVLPKMEKGVYKIHSAMPVPSLVPFK